MPVEIRELIIRTTVVNPSDDGSSEASTHVGDEAMIAACVAQVLKILERKRER